MGHLSESELVEKIAEANEQVRLNGCYAHYKDLTKKYRVVGFPLHKETDEVHVQYRAEYGLKLSWLTPLSNWLDTVEHEGQQVPRYQLVPQTPIP